MSPPSLRHPARLAGASLLRLQSDERLAELAANGHEAAFDAIVDRYRAPLTRYCAGIVGPSRAEDAAQQALINAHDALQRTDEVRHLRSWLYRIAHNASLNVLRAVRDDVSLDAASDATAVAEDGPAAAFERSERFRATVDALRELPERQRAALVLRELEGRSHEEIAESLGVTKGSARQHLMRARVALRGAVTAITPYPLVVRLAEMLASPGAAGWTDAAVGAGAGATLAKLTAGVAATGALVGGAVGTEQVVHHRHSGQDAAQRSTSGPATPARPAKARIVSLPASGTASTTTSSTAGSGRGSAGSGPDDRKGKDKNNDRADDHGRDHDGSRGRGSDGSNHNRRDDDASGTGSRGHGGRSGAAGGSGHGSGGNDDSRDRRGRRGSGSKDSNDAERDSAGRGSNRSRDEGHRSKGSGSGSSGGGGTGSSGSGGVRGPTLSGRRESSDDSSGSGSARDSNDDYSGSSTTTATPIATPTTTPSTDSNSGSGSGSGDSGRSGSDDDSGSSDRSGSSDGSSSD
jgi:RNA polymerase sigma factor (sigma-70 family)